MFTPLTSKTHMLIKTLRIKVWMHTRWKMKPYDTVRSNRSPCWSAPASSPLGHPTESSVCGPSTGPATPSLRRSACCRVCSPRPQPYTTPSSTTSSARPSNKRLTSWAVCAAYPKCAESRLPRTIPRSTWCARKTRRKQERRRNHREGRAERPRLNLLNVVDV